MNDLSYLEHITYKNSIPCSFVLRFAAEWSNYTAASPQAGGKSKFYKTGKLRREF